MAISQAKKLELITKHAKKFTVKPGGGTPVLEGVRYLDDGSVVATDRHTLLRIGGAHNFAEAFTSHAKTGAPVDGQYPDTSRLIPMEFTSQITLSATNLKDSIACVKVALEAAKLSAGDRRNLALLRYADDAATLSVTSDNPTLTFSAGINADLFGPDMAVAFNAEYMLNALNVFKDAGSQRVIIGLSGNLQPIILRDEDNEIDVIVLPYRIAS
ncbi:hypothetical protein BSK66_07810 [Paenibacillus odorifer]|uniref:DNA polymerase III beta sliding clamp C-terminal domain-containing protein n=1 Tax=Paenibacillus odorifer TaxID=189426 RepID=A0A1R0X2X2_9BACL|nr:MULTISPECIES: hypothetical protein [Paenibacillus]ETT64908.1 DNA polymerase III subunit beta [Paenibacillus sp. FSL H8-237]OMD27465.1 hypothetical protein BJP51_25040 [Paenibacillus odorifer]OME61027.1 hypothetical protein BSK66_07810 [Paenibacillus odorifer]